MKLNFIQDNIDVPTLNNAVATAMVPFECMAGMLQLAAISDNNFCIGTAIRSAISLNLANNIHTLNNIAKDNMLAVQPGSLNSAKEELGAIGVRSSIGHGQDARAGVTQSEVLISKLGAIDGLPTSAIAGCEVTTLTHEVGDHTMETAALVAEALLTSTQGTEVLSSLGHNVGTQLQKELFF